MNADNATSNDTQGETLADMPNSFSLENHVRCFNHTLQLSAKTLLRPFNAGLGKMTDDGDNNNVDDLDADDHGLDKDDDDDGNDNDNDNDNGNDNDNDNDNDNANDNDNDEN